MEKKLETVSILTDFVDMMERNYNMKVCILNINFGKVHYNTAMKSFWHTNITWKLSRPHAQYQNGFVK